MCISGCILPPMKTTTNTSSKARRGEPMAAGGRLVGTVGALEVVCYEAARWDEMCEHFDRVFAAG